jgi:putative ABC transport system permease protein
VRETLLITGTAPAGLIPAELVLARDVVRDHDRSALALAAFTATAAATPGAELVSVATYAERADAEEDRLVWSFTLLLLVMSAGAGALAVANTLLMATRHRVRDYRVLRLAGATPRQVALTVALESALVVTIGSILGGATAMLALLGSAGSLAAQVGAEISVIVPWPLISVIVGACLVLALVASTPSALRTRPSG